MKTIYIHPELGEIVLSSTRRATRLSLTVRPSGEIRLSYPPLISQKRALTFLESKKEWVEQSRRRYAERRPCVSYTAEQIEQLRSMAKAFLPQRTEELAEQFNFRYNKVTIRATRSKWGSCTRQGNISLSLFLMTIPEHLRDYVILHELAHTKEMNHGPGFWKLLDSMTDGASHQLRAQLRKFKTDFL